jgi:hypothetical protein
MRTYLNQKGPFSTPENIYHTFQSRRATADCRTVQLVPIDFQQKKLGLKPGADMVAEKGPPLSLSTTGSSAENGVVGVTLRPTPTYEEQLAAAPKKYSTALDDKIRLHEPLSGRERRFVLRSSSLPYSLTRPSSLPHPSRGGQGRTRDVGHIPRR